MKDPKPTRLGLLYTILLLSTIALAYIWIPSTGHRQMNVMLTISTVVVAILLIFIWAMAFARLPGGIRLRIAGAFMLFLILAFSTLRIRGVTGDLVPILAWRWSEQSFGTVLFSSEVSGVQTQDFPQFLGPYRNGTIGDKELISWESNPPKEVWRIKVGEGWAAFAVSGQIAVTQEQRGEEECVVAYDLATGEQLWVHADEARYASALGGVGPRATPTIDEDRVYTIGSTGLFNCLDVETGSLHWSKNILDENSGRQPEWGLAGSPLILDKLVIVSPGGSADRSLVAYSKDTGAFVWGGGTVRAGYSSPSLHTVAGREQILIFNGGSVAGHDPADGKVLWEVDWPLTECVAQPLPISENRVFVSTGYGIGCKLFEISTENGQFRADLLYETPRLKAKFANFVHYEGYIYGLDDGVFVCLDPETGQRKWKRGRYGHGQILRVGGKLIVQTEDGEIVLVELNPEKLIELAKLPALNSKTWNNPILAGSLMIVRNDREAVCYEVGLEDDAI